MTSIALYPNKRGAPRGYQPTPLLLSAEASFDVFLATAAEALCLPAAARRAFNGAGAPLRSVRAVLGEGGPVFLSAGEPFAADRRLRLTKAPVRPAAAAAPAPVDATPRNPTEQIIQLQAENMALQSTMAALSENNAELLATLQRVHTQYDVELSAAHEANRQLALANRKLRTDGHQAGRVAMKSKSENAALQWEVHGMRQCTTSLGRDASLSHDAAISRLADVNKALVSVIGEKDAIIRATTALR